MHWNELLTAPLLGLRFTVQGRYTALTALPTMSLLLLYHTLPIRALSTRVQGGGSRPTYQRATEEGRARTPPHSVTGGLLLRARMERAE